MAKPIHIELYHDENSLYKALNKLGVTYRVEQFFNRFWGTRFIIEKPTGRRKWDKETRRILENLQQHDKYNKTIDLINSGVCN